MAANKGVSSIGTLDVIQKGAAIVPTFVLPDSLFNVVHAASKAPRKCSRSFLRPTIRLAGKS